MYRASEDLSRCSFDCDFEFLLQFASFLLSYAAAVEFFVLFKKNNGLRRNITADVKLKNSKKYNIYKGKTSC